MHSAYPKSSPWLEFRLGEQTHSLLYNIVIQSYCEKGTRLDEIRQESKPGFARDQQSFVHTGRLREGDSLSLLLRRNSRHDRLPSLHMLAEIDEQFVGGFEVDQIRPRVLDVEHDVYDDDCEDCEAEDMEPTPLLATRHPKPRQRRTNETQAEQKRIDDPCRVKLQCHCAHGRDVDHVV